MDEYVAERNSTLDKQCRPSHFTRAEPVRQMPNGDTSQDSDNGGHCHADADLLRRQMHDTGVEERHSGYDKPEAEGVDEHCQPEDPFRTPVRNQRLVYPQ